MASVTNLLTRPRPPEDLLALGAVDAFQPAADVLAWIRSAYLEEAGTLYSPDHAHLADAEIGVLWTTAENVRQGRRIVGQAERPLTGRSGGRWQRAREECQIREWFGDVPDFLLTFDAFHADQIDDATFCALVDHELCHCAQAQDDFGMPKFNQFGEPMWTLRGHDVEEFVSVVRRFGVQAAGEAATELVIAAAQRPEIAPVRIAQACGTCVVRAA